MIWSIKLRGLCIVGCGFNLCFLGHFIGEMGGLLNKTCVVFGNYINYRYLCRHLGLENYNNIVNFYIFLMSDFSSNKGHFGENFAKISYIDGNSADRVLYRKLGIC